MGKVFVITYDGYVEQLFCTNTINEDIAEQVKELYECEGKGKVHFVVFLIGNRIAAGYDF